MIKIFIPNNYIQERSYIIHVIFVEFLGLKVDVIVSDIDYVSIQLDGHEELVLRDGLFAVDGSEWLQSGSLPTLPLKKWDLSELPIRTPIPHQFVPVLFSTGFAENNCTCISEDKITLEVDILGSSFFILTRYEEYVNSQHDQFDRFPAKASIAYQENFITRPIVNEYLEILWALLNHLWPLLKRKTRNYRVVVSHDVDVPFSIKGNSSLQYTRNIIGDLFVRKDSRLALARVVSIVKYKLGFAYHDINDAFGFIMDASDQYGCQSTFNFMASQPEYDVDFRYSLNDERVQKLMYSIYSRGHKLGFHSSLHSYNRPEIIFNESMYLRQLMDSLGITQTYLGGRQHYLCWQNPITWQGWSDANLDEDSTLGFADCIGFRCGVCYSYSVFNLKTRKHLSLIESPLIAMDVCLTNYMKRSHNEIICDLRDIAMECRYYNGEMSLLWHNDCLIRQGDRDLYHKVLSDIN